MSFTLSYDFQGTTKIFMAYICFPGWHCNTIFCFPVELWLHVCKCQKLSPTQTDLLVFDVNEWSESLDTRGLWYLRDPPLDWLKCRTLGIVYIWCNYPQAFDEEFSRRFQLPTRLSSPRVAERQPVAVVAGNTALQRFLKHTWHNQIQCREAQL